MKVFIGNYRSRWISTIHDRHMTLKYGLEWTDNQDWEDRAWEKVEDVFQWVYNHTVNLYFDKRSDQKIQVRIDRYDTWSMDHTLAHIVVPMLKQLKETKHGSPYVDDVDVPEHLRNNSPNDKEFWNGDIDDFHHARWEWVLDEMIWAFEQKSSNEDALEQFYDLEEDPDSEYGFKLTREDAEGRKAYQDRMSNGFRLFGRYYEALWD